MADSNSNGAAANVAATATAALATRKTTQVPVTMAGMKSSSVADIFSMYKEQIQRAIPKHLTAERVIQLATTMVSRNPDLAQCTSESLIGAVMQASILGFEPVASLGQIYFIPRNNSQIGRKEVTVIIGYKGLIDLARRSGEIKTIDAHCVYANDEFSYSYGLNPTLIHVPSMGERGKLICAYAVSTFLNGGSAFEVMSLNDIEKVRKESSSAKSAKSPWNTNYDEMARKTPLRKLCKMLPMSVSSMKAMQVDNVVLTPKSFDADGVDLAKVTFDTDDGSTSEAVIHTADPAATQDTENEAGTGAEVVNEATSEVLPGRSEDDKTYAATERDDREPDEELFDEISELREAHAKTADIQTWYQANLTTINSMKPSTKAKPIMDMFRAALAESKKASA